MVKSRAIRAGITAGGRQPYIEDMRKATVVPIAALMALSVLPAAPAIAAADTTPPRLTSITFDQSAVTVSGLATKFVDVRVRLTDDTGVEARSYLPSEELPSPSLQLNATPNSMIFLSLAEGDAQDGIWTGRIPVTSAWSGKVEPIAVYAQDAAANKLVVDPRTIVDTPSLQVSSSHRPSLRITFTPEPLPAGKPFVEIVTVLDTTTGKPWPNLSIRLSDDNGCVEPGGVVVARTGTNGVYRRTLPWSQRQWLHCAWVPGLNQPIVAFPPTWIAHDVRFARTERYRVYATAAATSVKAGTNVNVTGSVSPVRAGKLVFLQRYISGRTWRSVGSAPIRASGRYTLVATPPGKATYQYRVYAPGDDRAVGSLSATVRITGL